MNCIFLSLINMDYFINFWSCTLIFLTENEARTCSYQISCNNGVFCLRKDRFVIPFCRICGEIEGNSSREVTQSIFHFREKFTIQNIICKDFNSIYSVWEIAIWIQPHTTKSSCRCGCLKFNWTNQWKGFKSAAQSPCYLNNANHRSGISTKLLYCANNYWNGIWQSHAVFLWLKYINRISSNHHEQ